MRTVHLALLLQVLLCHGRPGPKFFGNDDKAKLATCVFDVWGAIDALGFAGLALNAATQDCETTKTDTGKTACTASVGGVLGSFLDVASFLASAATDCASKLNNKAYCGADISGLLSAFANIAGSAASMKSACENPKVSTLRKIAVNLDRRLGANGSAFRYFNASFSQGRAARLTEPQTHRQNKALTEPQTPRQNKALNGSQNPQQIKSLPSNPVVEHRKAVKTAVEETVDHVAGQMDDVKKAMIAECVFDVHFTAQLLGRAGLGLNSAVQDCSDFNIKINGNGGQKVCAVDITGVIGSFVSVGQFLSAASSKCSGKPNPDADCSSAVFNVVAAIDGIAAVGASLPLTCGGEAEELNYQEFLVYP